VSVRVHVIGPVAVEHAGDRVEGGPLSARRTRLLLVALATADGPCSARDLAERLWAEPPPTWAAALRGAIAALRTALDPIGQGGTALVRTQHDGWALAPGAETDLRDAEQAVQHATDALVALEHAIAIASAQRALRLLDGEILPADDAPWIDALRRRRDAAESAALRTTATAALALGRWSVVSEAATRLLDRDQLDESAARLLIRALAASGDRAAAIRAFERCRAALVAELGVDPAPETAAVYLEVLQSGSAPSGTIPPIPRNRFVGRAAMLRAVVDALATGAPVTLVGRGGMGKSRLALEVAHDRGPSTPGGRFWVGLGDLPDAALVPSAIAAAVAAEGAADPLAAVIAVLAPAGRSLLVLDGCERHLDAIADTVAAMVAGVPGIAVLCTSRVPVGLGDERRIEVGPLQEAGPALLRSRLGERAGVELAASASTEAVARVCKRVGGVPLAIELAAAQLAALSVGDLLDGIDEAAGRADDVLDALVEQSWGGLTEPEAHLVRALAAVDGTVPLPLARAVAGDAVPGPRVARLLGSLGDAGFVLVDRSAVRWRYGVDPHLRGFARVRTREEEAAAALEALARALDGVVPPDAKAPPAPYRQAVDGSVDALRTVFDAAATGRISREGPLDLAFRLHRHWAATGVAEGRYWLDRLLDGAEPGETADLARFAAGYLAYWAGDAAATAALLPLAAAGLERTRPDFAARALLYAGGMSDEVDEPDRAIAELTASLELARRAGGTLVASVELGLASVLAERGDPAAVDAADRAIGALVADVPAAQWQAMHTNAALSAWRVGDLAAAHRFAREAEPILTADPSISRAHLAVVLAGLALEEGSPHEALVLLTQALDDERRLGVDRDVPLTAALAVRAAQAAGRADAALEDARIAVAAAESLAVPAAAALALEAVVAVRPDAAGAAALAATAVAVRARGKRPAPPSLRPLELPEAAPLHWRDALVRARAALD
jgi:DNA-binding SARP family transcriptional activator/predicted ATPase